MSTYYKLIPKQLGCEVVGINLQQENRPEVINEIKKDITTHRILLFKNQGVISGERHVEISKWFGQLESTFTKHKKSPHPDVFRVSNDEEEGCTNVGRTGWHIDGSFYPEPYSYSLYHMVSVPKEGATSFIPLTEIVEGLSSENFDRWNRLWMKSDRRHIPTHPLIYAHPISKKPVLCFHLGMTERFVWNFGAPNENITSEAETKDLLHEIYEEIAVKNKNLIYKHNWEEGEFIISDNLAIGHEANPETQLPRCKVGLRILHRTTIKGTHKPQKL